MSSSMAFRRLTVPKRPAELAWSAWAPAVPDAPAGSGLNVCSATRTRWIGSSCLQLKIAFGLENYCWSASFKSPWTSIGIVVASPVDRAVVLYSCTRTMLPLNESGVHRSAGGWTSYCCCRSCRKRFCASSCRIWPIWRSSSWFKEPCRSRPRRLARGPVWSG